MTTATLHALLAYFPLMMIAIAVEVRALRGGRIGGFFSLAFEALVLLGMMGAFGGAFLTLIGLLAPPTLVPPGIEVIISVLAFVTLAGALTVAVLLFLDWFERRFRAE